MKKIVFVGTSWAIAKYVDSAVTELGYKPVFLVNIDDFSTQIAEVIKKSEWYNVNISSYAAVEEFLEENWAKIGEIAAITSLSDSKLVTAEKLAEKFHVQGPDSAIKLLSDKNQVVQLIPEYSPETFHFFMKTIPLTRVHSFIEQYGAVVIKPTKGSGAMGTIVLREPLSVEDICHLLKETGLVDTDSRELLAQAYIEGTLYSLEGYCLEGKPTFLGWTRRSRISMTEMANHFPSDFDPLIQKHENQLYSAINALVERSHFMRGYFHCEFLVSDKGGYLIDANFGRIGGAAMIEQFAHSFNITPQEMTKHVIDVSLFGGEHLPSYRYNFPPKPSLCLCYGISQEGILRKVHLPPNLQSHHTIVAQEGVLIPPIGHNDYAWIGMISGGSEAVLQDIKQIQVETNQGFEPAYFYID